MRTLSALMLSVVGVACAPLEPIVDCDPIGNAEPLCGWRNPEDLARLPDGRHVVVSEYGGMFGEHPGTLALLDLDTDERIVVFDGSEVQEGPGLWGDPACPGTPGRAFSPHGIHVSQRSDGAWQVLAVQHGGRESIEWFEVVEGPVLAWRGCAVVPDNSVLNDIVATPDGGFLATQIMPRRRGVGQVVSFVQAAVFDRGGYVYQWSAEAGFEVLPGSRGPMANGIALADDGHSVFVAYSLSGELREIDLSNGEVRMTGTFDPIDNLTWAPDGALVAATGDDNPDLAFRCADLTEGTCPGVHAIVAIDPETFDHVVIYEGGPGTPGGMGTTGLVLDDGTLLIGTFAGDRLVRVTDAW